MQQLVRKYEPKKRAKVRPAEEGKRFVQMEEIKAVQERVAKQLAKNHVIVEEIATFDEIMY